MNARTHARTHAGMHIWQDVSDIYEHLMGKRQDKQQPEDNGKENPSSTAPGFGGDTDFG